MVQRCYVAKRPAWANSAWLLKCFLSGLVKKKPGWLCLYSVKKRPVSGMSPSYYLPDWLSCAAGHITCVFAGSHWAVRDRIVFYLSLRCIPGWAATIMPSFHSWLWLMLKQPSVTSQCWSYKAMPENWGQTNCVSFDAADSLHRVRDIICLSCRCMNRNSEAVLYQMLLAQILALSGTRMLNGLLSFVSCVCSLYLLYILHCCHSSWCDLGGSRNMITT